MMMVDDEWAEAFIMLNTCMAFLGVMWVIGASLALSWYFFGLMEILWPKLLAPMMALGLIYGGIGVPLFILKRRAEIKEWERERRDLDV